MSEAAAVWAILVAGGTGTRYNTQKSKLLEPLGGQTVLSHSFKALATVEAITGMVVVTHPNWEAPYKAVLQDIPYQKALLWATGGKTRRDSVWHGLTALPQTAQVVVIHDVARPLVKPQNIQAALIPVINGEAVGTSLGVPAQNTLKQVSTMDTPWVQQTLSRDQIWQVHTPQVFQKTVLIAAHQAVPMNIPINDDAELVERYTGDCASILMIADDPWNLKITTPADILLVEALLKQPAAKVAL